MGGAKEIPIHRRNVNDDTPLPPEIPHALNPPDGVSIDYWLGLAPSGPIALDILDAAGAVVRHYSSVPEAPVAEAARPPHPNFWVAVPKPLPATPGAHRVNWDLRHDAPPAFRHSFEINANPGLTPASPEGPLALPGVYTVRLTVDGQSLVQRVTVRNDPRSRATPAELAAQHALQMRIVAGLRTAWEGQQRVTALGAAADSVPDGATTTFRRVGEALAAQLHAQDNADLAPTAAMLAAFASVCRDLASVHSAWARALRIDLPAVHGAPGRQGGSAIPKSRFPVQRFGC